MTTLDIKTETLTNEFCTHTEMRFDIFAKNGTPMGFYVADIEHVEGVSGDILFYDIVIFDNNDGILFEREVKTYEKAVDFVNKVFSKHINNINDI